MPIDNKYWYRLIVTEPFEKELRRNTKWFNHKLNPDNDKQKRHHPVHGGFTEYGNLMARRLGIT